MFAPLPSIRLAQPFEALRDASDAVLARTGARPKVFLANLGKLADFTARAAFAKNFFEAGGIEALTNEGFASQAEMVAAFKNSGAKLVCICSSDKVYGAEAVEAAQSLKHANAMRLYLAGQPGDLEGALRAAGVEAFVYVGCDVLQELKAAFHALGE